MLAVLGRTSRAYPGSVLFGLARNSPALSTHSEHLDPKESRSCHGPLNALTLSVG